MAWSETPATYPPVRGRAPSPPLLALCLAAVAAGPPACGGSERNDDAAAPDAETVADAGPDADDAPDPDDGPEAEDGTQADAGPDVDAAPDPGADRPVDVDTVADADSTADAPGDADAGWPDCDPAGPCCNSDGTACEHGCDVLGIVHPAGTCWPTCEPAAACYEFDPATRGVGWCADGRFELNAVGGECRCLGQIGPRDEVCSGRDDDCDGETDEGTVCPCAEGEERYEECRAYGSVDVCAGVPVDSNEDCCGPTLAFCFGRCHRGVCHEFMIDVIDPDEDGFVAPEDCDDGDPDVHPGAPELCNGHDDDCDFIIDEGC